MLLQLAGDVHLNPGPYDHLKSSFVFCHTNVRSLRKKLDYIKCHLADSFDVITVSESWLTSADKSHNFKLNNFQGPIRKDRSFGNIGYGGVLLWVRNSIGHKRRSDLESPLLEALWVELRMRKHKFLLCVLYRQPSDSIFWENLQHNIDNVRSLSTLKVILVGDLNADLDTVEGRHLADFCERNNLFIHVDEPTRITPQSCSILDQIISNDRSLISSVNV